MNVGVQASGLALTELQREDRGQGTEGSYQSHTKDTLKAHILHFIPKAFN